MGDRQAIVVVIVIGDDAIVGSLAGKINEVLSHLSFSDPNYEFSSNYFSSRLIQIGIFVDFFYQRRRHH